MNIIDFNTTQLETIIRQYADARRAGDSPLQEAENRLAIHGCYNCSSSCYGTCYHGCHGTCSSGCYGCSSSCKGSCSSGCYGHCHNTCQGSCSSGCYGCSSTCKGTCSSGCYGYCSGTAKGYHGSASPLNGGDSPALPPVHTLRATNPASIVRFQQMMLDSARAVRDLRDQPTDSTLLSEADAQKLLSEIQHRDRIDALGDNKTPFFN